MAEKPSQQVRLRRRQSNRIISGYQYSGRGQSVHNPKFRAGAAMCVGGPTSNAPNNCGNNGQPYPRSLTP
jgi:hypothetical protein